MPGGLHGSVAHRPQAIELGESSVELTVVAGSHPSYAVLVSHGAGNVFVTPDFSEQPSWLFAFIEPIESGHAALIP